MSYQALARKWRPKTFAEVIGQVHVVKALANALDQERLHHAYLFTGTRGVGKTTIARIFAKCLNCERGVNSVPCGTCDACNEIDQGRFIDLLEVDAASRTKVEDTRELLDNVQYSPTTGRYKVYLIDEVHMLSGHSFNALLKTLEEPPPHVKFLLATTDPQKLPMTVLSRCLQFNLKKISDDAIAQHLEKLMQVEDIKYQTMALRSLAKAADGSVRDALSLLDQAIAYSDNDVTDTAIHEMLGTVPGEYLKRIMQALTDKNVDELMQCTHELAQLSADFASLFEDIIDALHQVALVQAVPSIKDVVEFDNTLINNLSEKLSPEEVQLFYQIALIGKRDLYLSNSPQSGLEMALLRMLSFKPSKTASYNPDAESINSTANETEKKTNKQFEKRIILLETLQNNNEDWSKLIQNLNIQGVAYSLASNCRVNSVFEDTIVLNLSKQHEGIATSNAKQKLEKSLQEYFNKELDVKFEYSAEEFDTPAKEKNRILEKQQSQAEKRAEEDEVVKALKAKFGAEIVEGSVKPIEE